MSAPTTRMDTYLTIASIRAVREYSAQPIADTTLTHILQAGRATGSARNRQNWLFYVIRNRDILNQVAENVSAPANVRGCQVAIAVVLTSKSAFDGGRATQNMMLAAWAEGVGSCPNGGRKLDEIKAILGITDDVSIATILSLDRKSVV